MFYDLNYYFYLIKLFILKLEKFKHKIELSIR